MDIEMKMNELLKKIEATSEEERDILWNEYFQLQKLA